MDGWNTTFLLGFGLFSEANCLFEGGYSLFTVSLFPANHPPTPGKWQPRLEDFSLEAETGPSGPVLKR